MEFLEAADKISIIRLIQIAHTLPVPIQDCLVTRVRRVGLAQFFGNALVVVLIGSIVAHLSSANRSIASCLARRSASCRRSRRSASSINLSAWATPGGGPSGVASRQPLVLTG